MEKVKLLKIGEVAALFHVSERHIRNQIKGDKFPEPILIGRSQRWNEKDVLEFINKKGKK